MKGTLQRPNIMRHGLKRLVGWKITHTGPDCSLDASVKTLWGTKPIFTVACTNYATYKNEFLYNHCLLATAALCKTAAIVKLPHKRSMGQTQEETWRSSICDSTKSNP